MTELVDELVNLPLCVRELSPISANADGRAPRTRGAINRLSMSSRLLTASSSW